MKLNEIRDNEGALKQRIRVGRGFSKGELEMAGLSAGEARRVGIRVDSRRRTVHEGNVETLKQKKS